MWPILRQWLLELRRLLYLLKVSLTLSLYKQFLYFTGPRPTAPPSFDEARARLELLEYYRMNHRKPGDPKLVPQLTQNHPITQNVPRYSIIRVQCTLCILIVVNMKCDVIFSIFYSCLMCVSVLLRDEQTRRSLIESTRYKIKVLYNNKEFHNTKDK